ncbi:phosphoserine phosphatase SerB [Turneriella parva]|uniref:Phosphoserine phosphatase n=1 Tax=Turneriella parva (strain ATCC BAA-1111 / DSM 21527 / NCTC 11395 / H) TaxID=869212 RepID=I4B8W4_TURPD|nr:phosphoserine phosphatase SerB [Turneriella parva]AFM13721.1 phosphoserine phosphatase SerB [Turneriella parva DSM 21527]
MESRRLVLIARENLSELLSAVASAVKVDWQPKKEALSGTMCTVGESSFNRVSVPIAAVDAGAEQAIREVMQAHSGANLVAYALKAAHKVSPRLVVFDTDSTFINQEVIDEIAAFAGFKKEVAEITERAMRGELDFNKALAERVLLLKGVSAEVLPEIKRSRLSLSHGASELVESLHARGIFTYLLSGGFSFFTSAFRRDLKLTGDFANELEIVDGRLTGKTLGAIVNRQRKAELLRELATQHGVSIAETVAVGDGANDIDMAVESGMGVAFCAKPALVNAVNAAIFERDLRFVAELAFA